MPAEKVSGKLPTNFAGLCKTGLCKSWKQIKQSGGSGAFGLFYFQPVALMLLQGYHSGLKRLIRSALDTTDTELKAMAVPATTGLKNPMAATGMPMVL